MSAKASAQVDPPALQAYSTSRTCCCARLTMRAWLSGLQGNNAVMPLSAGRTSRQSSAGAQAASTQIGAIQNTVVSRHVQAIIERRAT